MEEGESKKMEEEEAEEDKHGSINASIVFPCADQLTESLEVVGHHWTKRN